MPRHLHLPRWPYLIGTLVAGIAPLAVFLALAYLQALHDAEVFLTHIVDVAAERAESLLTEAEIKLTRFVEVAEGELTPETERLLRQLVYIDPKFREAGIIDQDGFLVFSTAAPIEVPIAILAHRRIDKAVPGLQVVGLLQTKVMGEESIVVGLPAPSGGEVNLLVDPAVLALFLDDAALGPDGYLAYVGARGAVVVVGEAQLPADADAAASADVIGVTRDFRLGRIEAAVGRSWALEDWFANLRFAVPVAVVCGVILIVVVLRLINHRMGLDHDLRLGIRRDEFHVEYRPIIDLETGNVVATEALLRWHHPSHGHVGPDTFIGIAEQTGLIAPLTAWLLARVARDQGELLRRYPDLRLTINCPASLLTTRALKTMVKDIPASLPADRLIFELTEHVFVADEVLAREVMMGLRNIGYRFALDDFGAGYSGLGSLQRFQFEFVKIDRSFVQAIEADRVSATILDTLIELAEKLGAGTVVEGIETETQLQHVQARHVRYAQGWLFSTPLGIDELERFLASAKLPTPAA